LIICDSVRIGPFFFGVIWNWFLLGMLLLQLYFYSLRRRKDGLWIRILVLLCVTLDLAETGLSTHGAYQVLVEFWGIRSIEVHPPKTFLFLPLSDALIASLVQSFFGWRIWKLGRRSFGQVLAPLIFVLALLQTAGAFVSTILEEEIDNQTELAKDLGRVNVGYLLWLTTNLAVDVIIAATMLTILASTKAAVHFSETQDLMSRLMRRVVATGAITATVVAVTVGLFLHKTGNNYFITPGYILGKLYSNSLMANLNARPDDEEGSSRSSTSRATNSQSLELQDLRIRLRSHIKSSETGTVGQVHVRRTEEVLEDGIPSSLRSKEDVGPGSFVDSA